MRVEPGKCSCGEKVVRGEADDGTVVTLGLPELDAAHELAAWASGTPTHKLAMVRGRMDASPRTARDIKLKPAGFDPGTRILLEHRCAEKARRHARARHVLDERRREESA